MSELTERIAAEHWITVHPTTHCVACGWWKPDKEEGSLTTLRRHIAEVAESAVREQIATELEARIPKKGRGIGWWGTAAAEAYVNFEEAARIARGGTP